MRQSHCFYPYYALQPMLHFMFSYSFSTTQIQVSKANLVSWLPSVTQNKLVSACTQSGRLAAAHNLVLGAGMRKCESSGFSAQLLSGRWGENTILSSCFFTKPLVDLGVRQISNPYNSYHQLHIYPSYPHQFYLT